MSATKSFPRLAVHPFPARMAAAIPWKELCATSGRSMRVVDPMAGSGTTIVAARALGHRAFGFDTDPLAVLIARASCGDVPEKAFVRAAERVHSRAEYLERTLSLHDSYPRNADEETKRFIRFWFDRINRRQLAAYSRAISTIRDDSVRTLLWCAFSRLIITKQASASLAGDVAHSRPHRVLNRRPIRPFGTFLSSVRKVLMAAPFRVDTRRPQAVVQVGDARQLPLCASSIDMVITSPPYLNAIDYLRGHKFSLVWMGYKIPELRRLRATNIGSEVSADAELQSEIVTRTFQAMSGVDSLTRRERGVLARYIVDMNCALSEIARVLVPDGRAILVVGDCTLRGVYIRNSDALIHLAKEHGLQLSAKRVRSLPANRRYLPPPSLAAAGKKLQSRMRKEILLTFSK